MQLLVIIKGSHVLEAIKEATMLYEAMGAG